LTNNPELASHEIKKAAEYADKLEYPYADIGIIYALLNGLEGCVYAAKNMAKKPRILQGNLVNLLEIAIKNSTNKKRFIGDLWKNINNSNEY
jgi:hypothetical protein